MEIGDKVKLTYANGDQYIGRIYGETEKMWKIDFDGTLGTKRVNKNSNVVLIDDPKTPEKEVISYPKGVDGMLKSYIKKQERNLNWKMALIVGVTLLLATTAVLVGLDIIQFGVGSIIQLP